MSICAASSPIGWLLLLIGACGLSAQDPALPGVVDISGGRVQQAGANYQAGEKIRPVGWSKTGKFAWIVEHFVDGRGGTRFAYLIANTTDDKIVARIDDDSENWETRQHQDDAAESWLRNHKKWASLLETQGIEAGSGLDFRPFPLILGEESYGATLTVIPNSAGPDDADLFPNAGFSLNAHTRAGVKQVARENKVPCSTAWVSGYFMSPFEKRILVVVGRESYVFEGTEFFYHFFGCRLDTGFKTSASSSKQAN